MMKTSSMRPIQTLEERRCYYSDSVQWLRKVHQLWHEFSPATEDIRFVIRSIQFKRQTENSTQGNIEPYGKAKHSVISTCSTHFILVTLLCLSSLCWCCFAKHDGLFFCCMFNKLISILHFTKKQMKTRYIYTNQLILKYQQTWNACIFKLQVQCENMHVE